jgi:hypothetical protein
MPPQKRKLPPTPTAAPSGLIYGEVSPDSITADFDDGGRATHLEGERQSKEREEEARLEKEAQRKSRKRCEAKKRREAQAQRKAAAGARYVIVVCTYEGTKLHLEKAAGEAKATADALPDGRVSWLDNPDAALIAKELKELDAVASIHLIAHGDFPLGHENVPLLSPTTGDFEAPIIAWWVELIKPLVAKGLRYVYLGGCCSIQLGRALSEQAGVPVVVCFEGKVESGAAKIFGPHFAQEIGNGITPAEAFDAARRRVRGEKVTRIVVTAEGERAAAALVLKNQAAEEAEEELNAARREWRVAFARAEGEESAAAELHAAEERDYEAKEAVARAQDVARKAPKGLEQVQRYEFVSPDDSTRVHQCRAASHFCTCQAQEDDEDPTLRCPWKGRLLPKTSPLCDLPPEEVWDLFGWKGQLAAGVPKLL